MSVAQQQSMHGLGFTPRSWELRIEPALRLNSWDALSETQRQAALVLGWQPQSWHKARGQPAQPLDKEFTWVKPEPPAQSPRLFPRLRPDFTTLGLFSQPSSTNIGDQYRAAAEVVERKKRYADSGLISAALMDRSRGKQFANGSARCEPATAAPSFSPPLRLSPPPPRPQPQTATSIFASAASAASTTYVSRPPPPPPPPPSTVAAALTSRICGVRVSHRSRFPLPPLLFLLMFLLNLLSLRPHLPTPGTGRPTNATSPSTPTPPTQSTTYGASGRSMPRACSRTAPSAPCR